MKMFLLNLFIILFMSGNASVYEQPGKTKSNTDIPVSAIEHSSNVRPAAQTKGWFMLLLAISLSQYYVSIMKSVL